MIVITGGGGFIGSNLAAALEDRGAGELVICDSLGAGGKWRNIAKREIAAFIQPERLFDFLDANAGDLDAIFHMGAISSTTETDADRLIRSNFTLSLDLWEWCARHDSRLIYASSAATYGDGGAGFDDEFSTAALARLKPLNAYGWSKHLFDRRVARAIENGAPAPRQWVGLKFFNVYGPNEYHKGPQQSVAAQIYPVAKRDGTAILFKSHHPDYPDGGQSRDFVWVEDCADVMCWLFDHPDVSGLFNMGTGKARSFADLARAVFAALGKEANIDYVDTPEEIREKYQYFTEAKMDRLGAAGYDKAFTAIEEGVGRYVRDYLDTDDPYR
ncbi:MAG: ADP-glyceromanno-heptose 6-epimerase [Proteobacteria bacterium]|nr:ADP-glyceromanno-heptose 6-epimerase [Pseudomonadota bacterium]